MSISNEIRFRILSTRNEIIWKEKHIYREIHATNLHSSYNLVESYAVCNSALSCFSDASHILTGEFRWNECKTCKAWIGSCACLWAVWCSYIHLLLCVCISGVWEKYWEESCSQYQGTIGVTSAQSFTLVSRFNSDGMICHSS